MDLSAGVLLAIGRAVALGRPVATLVSVLIGAAIFGGAMYTLVIRRFGSDAAQGARPVPSEAAEETRASTGRRVGLGAVALFLPLLAFALVARSVAILAGIVVGNGVALLAVSAWFERWEAAHGVELLREPRYRWRRGEEHRGRGLLDGRDFYVRRAAPRGRADHSGMPRRASGASSGWGGPPAGRG